jgi:hypothetical protein
LSCAPRRLLVHPDLCGLFAARLFLARSDALGLKLWIAPRPVKLVKPFILLPPSHA